MFAAELGLILCLVYAGLPAGDGPALQVSREQVMSPLWLSPAGAWRVLPGPWGQMNAFAISRFFEELATMSFDRRLQAVSGRFLEVPYLASPLGEGGKAPDPDPLLRFDAVDCTTFVEQSMALALARNLSEALYWLRRIRYIDGRIDYARRKHFMMAQWIPANQADGFLQDLTESIAGEDLRWIEKCIDAEIWARRKPDKPWPALSEEQVPQGCFRLPILPIGQVLARARAIPSGTLVNILREDFHTMPTRVTHQGFLIQRDGRSYLRHAGRAGWGRVVDEDLERFVERNQAYRKWPVNGFNFQRILPASRTLNPEETRGRRFK